MRRKIEIQVSCASCGKPRIVAPWNVKANKTGNFFCNQACANVFQKGENSYSWKGGKIEVFCVVCGKSKFVDNWSYKTSQNHVCSRECQNKWSSINPVGFAKSKGELNNNWKGGCILRPCSYCGKEKAVEPYMVALRKNFFCDFTCKGKWMSIHKFGNNVGTWKGGIVKRNVVLFDDYEPKLSVTDSVQKGEGGILEVKCTYCGRYFIPTRNQVSHRLLALDDRLTGEARFYCSQPCKKNCGIFWQRKYPKGFAKTTSREVQPELRQLVFERDLWECQICGDENNLHCHHIEGVAQNPIESADLDNCITLCKSHHKWVHSKAGCKYSDLRCRRLTT
jgi:hypothetical protein